MTKEMEEHKDECRARHESERTMYFDHIGKRLKWVTFVYILGGILTAGIFVAGFLYSQNTRTHDKAECAKEETRNHEKGLALVKQEMEYVKDDVRDLREEQRTGFRELKEAIKGLDK